MQESRSERALEALRDLSSPRALVIRDGEQRRIAGREVVRGDVLVLAEGDRVPADAVLLERNDLAVDESLLTGESVPVRKMRRQRAEAPPTPPGGDDLPFVFSGTLVVARAAARRGARDRRAHARSAGSARRSAAIEARTRRCSADRGASCAAVAARRRRSASRVGAALRPAARRLAGRGLLAGIALAWRCCPRNSRWCLTVFLALGAWRICAAARADAPLPAIETLGAATVLCADKTGTLTENRMAVARTACRRHRA